MTLAYRDLPVQLEFNCLVDNYTNIFTLSEGIEPWNPQQCRQHNAHCGLMCVCVWRTRRNIITACREYCLLIMACRLEDCLSCNNGQ